MASAPGLTYVRVMVRILGDNSELDAHHVELNSFDLFRAFV